MGALGGLIALLVPTVAIARGAAAEIRDLRARSNAAIARHDVAGMQALFLPDAVVLPGSSGTPSAMDGFAARIGKTFADPTFVTYVRTPERVRIGRSARRAAESGRWVGIWRKPDGEMRMSGVYQAMWLATPEGWRIRNESFVSLACVGSRECAGAD